MQVRGSIPVLWEQLVTMKYTPRCVMSPNKAASFAAFAKHMSQQFEHYGRIVAVNLIDQKGDQKLLGDAFGEAVKALGKPADQLKYVWFDFHKECAKMRWSNLAKLMAQVDEDLVAHG